MRNIFGFEHLMFTDKFNSQNFTVGSFLAAVERYVGQL
jgi:hypothetical protein